MTEIALPPLFNHHTQLQATFADGLTLMLEQHDGLGVHILVLANAASAPALWAALAPRLRERHARHAGEIAAALRAGRHIAEPEDDLLVFLKLMAMGFEAVACAVTRKEGPWTVQFNPVRALRPPRASAGKVEGLHRPFDAAGFHFNKPFLAKEVFWAGELLGKPARLLYNKFPFAPLHGLLVPEPDAQRPQWLTPGMHQWAWEVAASVGANIPGFGVSYNSMGAQASVNHLHFQTFVGQVPVQDAMFVHNGGATPYPIACEVALDAESAWLQLDALHARGTPYNLLYAPGRLAILARETQGLRALPAWSGGMGWSEMAGLITVFNQDDFAALDAASIAASLAELAPCHPV